MNEKICKKIQDIVKDLRFKMENHQYFNKHFNKIRSSFFIFLCITRRREKKILAHFTTFYDNNIVHSPIKY